MNSHPDKKIQLILHTGDETHIEDEEMKQVFDKFMIKPAPFEVYEELFL